MSECFDEVIRGYIDLVNRQVGVYMDALAGFAGHYVRVERQINRVLHPKKSDVDPNGDSVVLWASYEDPTKPEVIHNRIIRATQYIAANAPGGMNEQQHARAILVFLFTCWEEDIRPRLADAKGISVGEIQSDVMGDLRIIRNVILHAKGIMLSENYRRIKTLGHLFEIDKPLHISYENMHEIFVAVKQDCARMMLEWLGVKEGPIRPEEIVDLSMSNPSDKSRDSSAKGS